MFVFGDPAQAYKRAAPYARTGTQGLSLYSIANTVAAEKAAMGMSRWERHYIYFPAIAILWLIKRSVKLRLRFGVIGSKYRLAAGVKDLLSSSEKTADVI